MMSEEKSSPATAGRRSGLKQWRRILFRFSKAKAKAAGQTDLRYSFDDGLFRKKVPLYGMSIPKYSIIELERRWLIPFSFAQSLSQMAYRKIDDLYLTCGRLRLRAITDSQTGKLEFKFCKKYGSISNIAEPIVNTYLTVEENAAISTLSGHKLSKKRFKKSLEGIEYSFDVFEGELAGLIICEIEADSESSLNQFKGPSIAIKEVTGDSVYTGGNLCRLNRSEVHSLIG